MLLSLGAILFGFIVTTLPDWFDHPIPWPLNTILALLCLGIALESIVRGSFGLRMTGLEAKVCLIGGIVLLLIIGILGPHCHHRAGRKR